MNIYKVSQNKNTGYDTYDSFVIICETEEQARYANPGGFYRWHDNAWYFQYSDGREKAENDNTWCDAKDVEVELVGKAEEGKEIGIICSSFNAG